MLINKGDQNFQVHATVLLRTALQPQSAHELTVVVIVSDLGRRGTWGSV